MMALLIKDWRLNAPATLCLFLIYAVLPFIIFFGRAADEGIQQSLRRDMFYECLMGSAFAGIAISLLIVPAFGAIAFARERRDRSAEFLAATSVARSRVVASKVVVAIALCMIPWMLSGILVVAAQAFQMNESNWFGVSLNGDNNLEPLSWLLRIHIMLFGIAWLLSSILRSETIAAAAAILGVVLLSIGYVVYRSRLEHFGSSFEAEATANLVATIATLTLGIGGFIAGTIIALRRVSP